jgi:hypothetical protein
MFSRPLLGTEKNKVTMSWVEYYITHVFPTGWDTIVSAFRIWKDLMTNNYKDYSLLKDDDPFEECREWFWATLGEDDVYPKFFLEELMQMADDVTTGKVKVYPIGENILEDLHNLVGDLIDPVDLNDLIDDEDLENEV